MAVWTRALCVAVAFQHSSALQGAISITHDMGQADSHNSSSPDASLLETKDNSSESTGSTESSNCPLPCVGCPGDRVVVMDGIVPPCDLPCAPCRAMRRAAKTAAMPLQNNINALERRLHALRMKSYYRQLRRALKEQRRMAETKQLKTRLRKAQQSLVREQADLVQALEKAHQAELATAETKLRRRLKLAQAKAYRSGFKARGRLAGNTAPALRTAVVRNVVSAAHEKALKKIRAKQALAAYAAGLSVGKLLSGTSEEKELKKAPTVPFDVRKALKTLGKK